MTPHALLFTLAAIGIAETTYLIKQRRHHQKPVCVLGSECHIVLESKYSRMFGLVHNDILGLLFYFIVSFITAFIVIGINPYETWVFVAKIAISFATLMAFVFIYIQWRVLRKWCFWCLMAQTTVFLMGTIALTANFPKS